MMRWLGGSVAAGIVAAATVLTLLTVFPGAAQDATQFRDPAAEDLFRYARMAVGGGGGGVAHLRALIMKGRSRTAAPNGALVDCAVSIKILVPDHYIRIDTAKDSERIAGYAGKRVLSAIREGERTSLPPDDVWPQILKSERTRLARFLLGAATYVSPETSMIFQSSGGPPEMVDPRTNARRAIAGTGTGNPTVTIDLSNPERLRAEVFGEGGFAAQFIVDGTTRMPAKLTFKGADNGLVTMTFSDRRAAGGLQLPYRITTMAGDKLIDELVFDEILVNPEISNGDFRR